MCQRFIPVAVVALLLSASTAFAQCGCSSPPVYTSAVPSYSTYYAPPAADYRPPPYVSYDAPPAAPASYVSYYAPPVAYAAPVSYVSYYVPATTYATTMPAATYATYYAPAATYAPVAVPYRAYYGVPVSIYGTPRLYVPGEPVRNAVRAVTP